MGEKILFVDDEPNVLDGIRRHLHKRFELETACGPEEGLRKVRASGPFAVIVCDMRMPNMNGAEFLAKTRELFPDGVRMILSGQSDLDSAIAAVNNGNIFRFLTKPCKPEDLTKAINSAIDQYRLVIAERQLLEQTLRGSVRVLTEILGLLSPQAFSRTQRVQGYVEHMAAVLALPQAWQLGLAAMLCEIGCVSIPAETLAKAEAGETLTVQEQELIDTHPEFGGQLLEKIPRLDKVARMVSMQKSTPDFSSLPATPSEWEIETTGAQLLAICTGFDKLLAAGAKPSAALSELRKMGFPDCLVDALSSVPLPQTGGMVRSVTVDEIRVSMVLDQDVKTISGMLLCRKGQEVSETLLLQLRKFAAGVGVVEPCRVYD